MVAARGLGPVICHSIFSRLMVFRQGGSVMALLRIHQQIHTAANATIFDLFHAGMVTVSGIDIRLDRLSVLPVPVRKIDHISWQLQTPIRVSTPGPDSRITEIRQYRDRIEFSVWPWADVVLEFEK
jgi:hypothetical protein